jgi:hypothetical protein
LLHDDYEKSKQKRSIERGVTTIRGSAGTTKDTIEAWCAKYPQLGEEEVYRSRPVKADSAISIDASAKIFLVKNRRSFQI